MNRQDVGIAVFGAFDGITCCLGVLAGLLVGHATANTILTAAVGLAVAEAVGMAGGQRLGGGSWRLSAIMGAATAVGSLAPALPVVADPGPVGCALAGAVVIGFAVAIAEARRPTEGRRRAYAQTFAILAVAATASIALTLGVG